MTANRTTKRKDLHELVFILVLVVVIGVMAWFFNAHPGHGGGARTAAKPAAPADTTMAH